MGEPDTAEPARRAGSRRKRATGFVSRKRRSALADQVYRVARRFVVDPRGSRGSGAGHVRESIQELAVLHPGHEPPRLAPPDPHEPQRRPRPSVCSAARTRRRSRRATTTSRTAWPKSAGEQVLDQDRVVERLSQDSIVTALSSLPDDFRDVVVLVDIGDFSYADAAQILDIPLGTVMSRLHRGRRLLKAKLAEEAMHMSHGLRQMRGAPAGIPRPRADRRGGRRRGAASGRLRLLPAPLPLRGVAARLRAHDRGGADAARADGEARAAPHDRRRRDQPAGAPPQKARVVERGQVVRVSTSRGRRDRRTARAAAPRPASLRRGSRPTPTGDEQRMPADRRRTTRRRRRRRPPASCRSPARRPQPRVRARPRAPRRRRRRRRRAPRARIAATPPARAPTPRSARGATAPAVSRHEGHGTPPRRRRSRRPGLAARRSRTRGRSSACFGEPKRVAAPAARTTAATRLTSSRQ